MQYRPEEQVSRFYNTVGWSHDDDITEDARRWEDLREHSREYVSRCRLRVMRYIPEHGEFLLDMASGPIQYREYLEYSRNFRKRYCVDLSSDALESAREKIGNHGVYLHGSFLDLDLEENFFDCTISLHTIYHIDRDRQEEAVRKLVRVTKPGRPVIIVYSNPETIFRKSLLNRFFGLMRRRVKVGVPALENVGEEPHLYSFRHPLDWWTRFNNIADIEIVPWRSFDAETQKKLVPDNWLGSKILELLFRLEERFPKFFVKNFQYPMIILKKFET